jgi:multiple sugar transport system substrate-binding protein
MSRDSLGHASTPERPAGACDQQFEGEHTVARSRFLTAIAGVAAVAAMLTGCSGGGGGGGGNDKAGPAEHSTDCTNKLVYKDAPTVTVWGWFTNSQLAVDNFNKAHKNVQACWWNVGNGGPHYTKFQTAIAAGKGLPDVSMLEADHLTSYIIQGALVDISKYGANKVKDRYSEGAWKDVSAGNAVYAIPVDGGPVGMIYRKDIFDKYGVKAIPKTWAEYEAAAAKVKAAGGPLFGVNASNAQALMMALQIQKGAKPFTYDYSADPKKIGIKVNDQASKDVMAYWGNLVKKKLLGTTDLFGTDHITAITGGKLATYLGAAWAPGYLTGAGVAKSSGTFKVAPLPQWDPANPVEVNWGGSTYAVTSQAHDKKLAAEVAMGLYQDKATLDHTWKNQILFPLNLKAQNDPAFVNAKIAFFKGQQSNKEVYLPAAKAYKGATYSPFTTYYFSAMQQAIAAVNRGAEAGPTLDALQAKLVKYAKSQGFTVTE